MTGAGDVHLLAQAGFAGAIYLAEGMEGTVYSLDMTTVAKVWRPGVAPSSSTGELLARLSASGLPFGVPTPRGVLDLPDGRRATLETRLHGQPLDTLYDAGAGVVDERVTRALVAVLTGLHTAAIDMPATRVFNETTLDPEEPWSGALLGVLRGRLARFGGHLAPRVPRFDALVGAAEAFIGARADVAPVLQHGDLCGPNILIDAAGGVTGVLDWGFLTMRADPALDMALAASFWDMYGPHARRVDEQLTARFADHFSVEVEDLVRYKAVYSLMGANAYSSDAADGHFGWCVRTLNRPDVGDALGIWG